MRKAAFVVLLSLVLLPGVASAQCLPVTILGSPSTAAVVAQGGTVTGQVNATGCRIGIYFAQGTVGRIENAEVTGARNYGIYIDKFASVETLDTKVWSGDAALPGPYFGIHYGSGTTGRIERATIVGARNYGVLATANGADTVLDIATSTISPVSAATNGPFVGIAYVPSNGGTIRGTIAACTLEKYASAAVLVSGSGADVLVTDNHLVAAALPETHGVIFSASAKGAAVRNRIENNAYGVAVAGAGPGGGGPFTTDVEVVNNTLLNNDIGVVVSNYEVTGGVAQPVSLVTNNKVVNNEILCLAAVPATAGIWIEGGVQDKVINNRIVGCDEAIVVAPGLAVGTTLRANR